jgi:hypothetical protein
MTVKEPKEKLEQFPENCMALIPGHERYVHATHVGIGFNEMDGIVIIDDYVEDEDTCSGCVYEDVDGSTPAISNCVCCSRNVDFAKNDYYRKKQK